MTTRRTPVIVTPPPVKKFFVMGDWNGEATAYDSIEAVCEAVVDSGLAGQDVYEAVKIGTAKVKGMVE